METLGRRINNKFGTFSAFKGKYARQGPGNSGSPTTPEDPVCPSLDNKLAIADFGTKMEQQSSGSCSSSSSMVTGHQGTASSRSPSGHVRSASGVSSQGSSVLGLGNAGGVGILGVGGDIASRSLSMNSVSSDGSFDNNLVEQEDIVALTHDVRGFKEALSKLRRIFHPEREKQEVLRVAAHERLGEVLRILRTILEKYPPLQSTELLMAAGQLIQQVKGYNYENDKCNPTEFFETIDQLALAFSSRVSEYLMGDIDTSSALHPPTRSRSCENLIPKDPEVGDSSPKQSKDPELFSSEDIDELLMKVENGVNIALRRAKVWSKYAKDVITYIDKRASLEGEFSRNLSKLALSMRQSLKEESCLPFQSIYCTALDQDISRGNDGVAMCTALQEHKFVEPLSSRRAEHEKQRKQIKEVWRRELKRMQEATCNLRKAHCLYIQRNQEYEKAKESLYKAESVEGIDGSKIDKKKKIEDEASLKVQEAELAYKACVDMANERQQILENTTGDVLKQVRELMLQCDQTMKAVTVAYFQMQHTFLAPSPIQFQTLCENSRQYEAGSQYLKFVQRFYGSFAHTETSIIRHEFEPYSPDNSRFGEKDRRSVDSGDAVEGGSLSTRADNKDRNGQAAKAWGQVSTALGSDSDSIGSSQSNKSRDTSPTASPQVPVRRVGSHASSGDELEADGIENGVGNARRPYCSKAAITHSLKKLKTLAKCRECEAYVYFQGVECNQCGLTCHKKCLETLAIQCGHKKLPRKMTTFGVELNSHLQETQVPVPHLVSKCVKEIDERGSQIKGIYRVSGVKSRIEKLCQSFENGANLVDLSDVHPNVIANVLKLYLRQLPEPLMTFRLYPEFIRIAKEISIKNSDEEKSKLVLELKSVIMKLPLSNRSTLAMLMHHLRRVSELCTDNNMPPSNLGIVFGPTLLRRSEGGVSLSSLVDTVHQAKVVELLILHDKEIFGDDGVRQVDRESAGMKQQDSPYSAPTSLDEIYLHVTDDKPLSSHNKGLPRGDSAKLSLDSLSQDQSSFEDDWVGPSHVDDDTNRSSSFSDACSPDKSPTTSNVSAETKVLSKAEEMIVVSQETGPSISEDIPEDFESPLTRNYSLQGVEKQKVLQTSVPRFRNLGRGRGVATQTDLSFLRDLVGSPSSGSRNRQPSSSFSHTASLKGKPQTSSLETGKATTNISGDDNSHECINDAVITTKEASKNLKETQGRGLPHYVKPPDTADMHRKDDVGVTNNSKSISSQVDLESSEYIGGNSCETSKRVSDDATSHVSFSQTQTRQDDASQESKANSDDYLNRYKSPYLAEDPYKRYWVGVGGSVRKRALHQIQDKPQEVECPRLSSQVPLKVGGKVATASSSSSLCAKEVTTSVTGHGISLPQADDCADVIHSETTHHRDGNNFHERDSNSCTDPRDLIQKTLVLSDKTSNIHQNIKRVDREEASTSSTTGHARDNEKLLVVSTGFSQDDKDDLSTAELHFV